MRFKNTAANYGLVSSLIHWGIALMVLGMIGLGLYMVRLELSPFMFKLYFWHKSIGILILTLAILRVIWRFSVLYPGPLADHKPWERVLAKTVHFGLYIALFALPLSGWIMSSAKGFSVNVFGWFTLPDLVSESEPLAKNATQFHRFVAYALIGFLTLHIGGALKHHFIDKDATLKRMLPWKRIKPVIIILCGLFLVSSAASALAQEKIQDAPVDTPPAWTILPEDSAITFTGKQMGAPFEGEFGVFGGEIFFDPAALDKSRADITVDVTSVTTHSGERDRYILAGPWLSGEDYPQARFVITKIRKTGDSTYEAIGELTIKGISKPVTVPFTLDFETGDEGQETALMKGEFPLLRLDYSVGEGQWTDTEMVANELTVQVRIKAVRQ